MRLRLACGLLMTLLLPAWAAAEDNGPRAFTNRQACRRMTKQINHFEKTVLVMAKDRGNALWEQATEDQINRLKHQRADKCPEYHKQRTVLARAKEQAEQMKQMMAAAAKGAAKYFSGGAF